MPVGTIINGVSEELPLISLPPDGFVKVRRMTYGEELERSAISTKILIGGSGNNGGSPSQANFNGEMDIRSDKIALWDFANLIVDHNVTDEQGRKLDFRREADVRMLDSTVGKEIGQHIDDFNAAKESAEVKNS